jgi:hypothetical protein
MKEEGTGRNCAIESSMCCNPSENINRPDNSKRQRLGEGI